MYMYIVHINIYMPLNKVITRGYDNVVTTLSQPCHNLVTTDYITGIVGYSDRSAEAAE